MEMGEFPPYSYIPGVFPHPISDPAGHSYQQSWSTPPPMNSENWRQCELYQYGVDLFDRGYYWEAHEVWEQCWHGCGRAGAPADFLKGVIHLAAAGVKVKQGRDNGVSRHAAKAKELFERVADDAGVDAYFGLSLERLIALSTEVRDRPPAAPAATTHAATSLLGPLPKV